MKNLGYIAILLILLSACQTAPGDQSSQISDAKGPRQVEEADQQEPVKRWWEPEVAVEEQATEEVEEQEEVEEEEMDAARLASLIDDPEIITQGAELYIRSCVACHGQQGEGGLAKPINDGQWEHGSDPIDIYKATWDGLSGTQTRSERRTKQPTDRPTKWLPRAHATVVIAKFTTRWKSPL